ncbi:MAG: SPOR domain-containing protein [Muribaculaceae bacterium]|nr:SPOR domain-containing protein [Muribaculaceae bacterium]
MRLKYIMATATAVLLPLWLNAHIPADTISIVNAINASGNISVIQQAAMSARLTKEHDSSCSDNADTTPRSQHSNVGYRVQVYDDNNPHTARQNAEAYNARVAAMFPGIRTYVTFNSPYWQVKAGDFRSRAEAEAVMAEIRYAIPTLAPYLRIIRDRVNLTD